MRAQGTFVRSVLLCTTEVPGWCGGMVVNIALEEFLLFELIYGSTR